MCNDFPSIGLCFENIFLLIGAVGKGYLSGEEASIELMKLCLTKI